MYTRLLPPAVRWTTAMNAPVTTNIPIATQTILPNSWPTARIGAGPASTLRKAGCNTNLKKMLPPTQVTAPMRWTHWAVSNSQSGTDTNASTPVFVAMRESGLRDGEAGSGRSVNSAKAEI